MKWNWKGTRAHQPIGWIIIFGFVLIPVPDPFSVIYFGSPKWFTVSWTITKYDGRLEIHSLLKCRVGWNLKFKFFPNIALCSWVVFLSRKNKQYTNWGLPKTSTKANVKREMIPKLNMALSALDEDFVNIRFMTIVVFWKKFRVVGVLVKWIPTIVNDLKNESPCRM